MASEPKLDESTSRKWWRFLAKDGYLHPLWRLVLYLPVLAVTIIPVLLVFLVLDRIFAYKIIDPSRLTLNNAIINTTICLLGTWACQRFLTKRDMESLGLSFNRKWIRELLLGIMAGLGLSGFVFLIELSAGWINVQGFVWQTFSLHEISTLVYIGVISEMGSAIRYCIVLPGYLLQTLEEWKGLPFAAIALLTLLGSIYFVFVVALTATLEHSVLVIPIVLWGILLILAYLVRRSLWLPIGLYFAWRWFGNHIFALRGGLSEEPTVLTTQVTGPSFWVRAPDSYFGTELGGLDILAILLCIGVFWFILRRMSPHKRRAA